MARYHDSQCGHDEAPAKTIAGSFVDLRWIGKTSGRALRSMAAKPPANGVEPVSVQSRGFILPGRNVSHLSAAPHAHSRWTDRFRTDVDRHVSVRVSVARARIPRNTWHGGAPTERI